MKHILVAAFATLTDANRTRGDLMARAFPASRSMGAESADIHAYDAPYSTSPDVPVDRHEHESKVAHFFKSLFGHEPHEQHRHYATAYPARWRPGRGRGLARARDALEYNGAIDIDEHGGSGTADGYPGPSSPYAGATAATATWTSTSPDPQAERRVPPPAPACTRPANASVTTPAPALRLKSVPTPLPPAPTTTATPPTPGATTSAARPSAPAPTTRKPPPPATRPVPASPATAATAMRRRSRPASARAKPGCAVTGSA